MAFRIAQISDTHLSEAHPAFAGNFETLAAHLRAAGPDLVVHTGDVSAHGERAADDLHFARARLGAMGLDWVALPGNHDVGNDPELRDASPANAERLHRWLAVFGTDRFLRDVPGWRLIGLNSLITGADLPEAEAQFAFLAEALAGAAGRRVALFLHKPLCEFTSTESTPSYWSVQPAPRRRLLGLLAGHDVALVASGHVHQWWDRGVCEGLRQVWAPAVAFFVGDEWQEPRGEKPLGYVEHLLHEDGRHECRLVALEDLARNDIGFMPEVYGPQKPLA